MSPSTGAFIKFRPVEPGRWHNGSAFVFCSCGCTFETEPSPTSAHACGEVTRGEVNLGEWYITFASAKIVNQAEPTLGFETRGDITRNPKQAYQWPQKRTCVRQKLFYKKKFKKVSAWKLNTAMSAAALRDTTVSGRLAFWYQFLIQ